MTLTQSAVAHLYRMMPRPLTVTYHILAAADTFTSPATTVYRAEKRPLKQSELDAGMGRFSKSDRVWHLWVRQLSSIVPKEGDKIVDGDSVAWIVGSVDLELLDSRYRLTCKKGV